MQFPNFTSLSIPDDFPDFGWIFPHKSHTGISSYALPYREQPSLVMVSLSHAGQDQPKGQEKEDERHAGDKSLAHGVCDGNPYQASDANPN